MTNFEPDWITCPQGELNRLANRLRSRRRRMHTAMAGAALLLLLVVGFGVWSLRPSEEQYNFAGITCKRVQSLAMAYSEGTLAADLRDRVNAHIDQCPRCHDRFREMGLLSWQTRTIQANIALAKLTPQPVLIHSELELAE